MAQPASRLKKRPGRATGWASGRRLKCAGRLVVPDREQRDVGLAVVADLEAQLRRRRLAAGLDLARAEAGQVVELGALEAAQHDRRVALEGQHHAVLAHHGGALELGRRIARQRAQDERAGALVGHDRDHRAPAPGVVEPGQHLGIGLQLGEAPEQRLHRLGQAGVGRHAPVPAAPVEPAPRQLLDGLVELVVVGEVEDQLGLARIREQGDASLAGRGHQPVDSRGGRGEN